VLIILGVVLALGGGGCAVCVCVVVKKSDDASEQERLDKRRARNVRIDELLSAYRANEARADGRFKGKWVVVQGGVVDAVHSTYLTIGTGKFLEIPEVQCRLGPDQSSRAAVLSKGHRAIVRGKVQGLVFNVIINDCEIL